MIFLKSLALQVIEIDLPPSSQLYAYSGYTSYEVEDLLAECDQVALRVCWKSNATRKDEPWQAFLKNHYRKRIENTFSGSTNFFPKKIHDVTAHGFTLKIILFIFTFTLNQLIWLLRNLSYLLINKVLFCLLEYFASTTANLHQPFQL